jgi:hypothetical protein
LQKKQLGIECNLTQPDGSIYVDEIALVLFKNDESAEERGHGIIIGDSNPP